MRRRARESLDSLDDEIRDHIRRETEENIARGMAPDEAYAAARRAFGNATLTRKRRAQSGSQSGGISSSRTPDTLFVCCAARPASASSSCSHSHLGSV